MASVRAEVMRLYAACLRSAKRCPEPDRARQMTVYARLRFDDGKQSPNRSVRRMLDEGWQEVRDMEYYHAARDAKAKSGDLPIIY